jgi:hypothetical protein
MKRVAKIILVVFIEIVALLSISVIMLVQSSSVFDVQTAVVSGRTMAALARTQTAMPTPTTTLTLAPSVTPTATATMLPTATATITQTPLPTATSTRTLPPTKTPNLAETATADQLSLLRSDFPDGNYLVNVDIAPGVWRNDGTDSSMCYWETSTTNGSIIRNYLGSGGGTAYIGKGDFEFRSERCGVWTYLQAP